MGVSCANLGVRTAGFEPTWRVPAAPKAAVYTNSTTSAQRVSKRSRGRATREYFRRYTPSLPGLILAAESASNRSHCQSSTLSHRNSRGRHQRLLNCRKCIRKLFSWLPEPALRRAGVVVNVVLLVSQRPKRVVHHRGPPADCLAAFGAQGSHNRFDSRARRRRVAHRCQQSLSPLQHVASWPARFSSPLLAGTRNGLRLLSRGTIREPASKRFRFVQRRDRNDYAVEFDGVGVHRRSSVVMAARQYNTRIGVLTWNHRKCTAHDR